MDKTYTPKVNEVEKKWYIIDAKDKVIGRVATEAARLLRGKHRPDFSYNVDTGDYVIIINAKDAKLTGNKLDQKMYRKHSGYLGGLKETPAREVMKKNPERALYEAVKGMLPHTKLGAKQLKKLRIYADDNYEQKAQKPEIWEVK